MLCDEIQEGFIDLLYEDAADSHKNAELREHLRTCSNCRKEPDELKSAREYLQLWKDEPNINKTIVLSALKKDLDEFGRKNDRFQQFKQRMKIIEY